MRRYFKDSYEYQRIMEILDDYWLTCPDELYVRVDFQFINLRGETQIKHIIWQNPDYVVLPSEEDKKEARDYLELISMADIKEIPFEEAFPRLARLKKGIQEGRVKRADEINKET